MKAQEEQHKDIVRVNSVEVLREFVLKLSFDDGKVREVDIEDFLWGPVFGPLQDPAFFRQVTVDDELGTIVWPNGADMDPVVLHGSAEAVTLKRGSTSE